MRRVLVALMIRSKIAVDVWERQEDRTIETALDLYAEMDEEARRKSKS